MYCGVYAAAHGGMYPSGKRSGSNLTRNSTERSKTRGVGRYQIDGDMSPCVCVHVTKDIRQSTDNESVKGLNGNSPSQNRWGRVN